MKKKKLALKTENIRVLNNAEMRTAVGGLSAVCTSGKSCTQTVSTDCTKFICYSINYNFGC